MKLSIFFILLFTLSSTVADTNRLGGLGDPAKGVEQSSVAAKEQGLRKLYCIPVPPSIDCGRFCDQFPIPGECTMRTCGACWGRRKLFESAEGEDPSSAAAPEQEMHNPPN